MRNVAAIFGKEMRSYFGSPVAYVMAGVFLFLTGLAFMVLVFNFEQLSRYAAQQMHTERPDLNVNEYVVAGLSWWQFVFWSVITPMLTMRLYAEEERSGTLELLMTSPVSVWQTLLGKFGACFGLYVMVQMASLVFLAILSMHARLDWGPVISASVSVLMGGAAFISVGILASALTDNQVVAVVLSLSMLLLLWVVGAPARFAGPALSKLLRYLSVLGHMEDMNRGVVDTTDVVFFLSTTFLFLFLTHTVIESRRWRQ